MAIHSSPVGASTSSPLEPEPAGAVLVAKSPNTVKAYRSDWERFCEWAASRGLETLPAAPDTVGLYVTELAPVTKISTIARRLASIAHVHRAARWPSPTDDAHVKRLWALVRRSPCIPATPTLPIGAPLLRRMVERVPQGLGGVRDRALLLVGFGGALRRSELVALDVEDVAAGPEGLLLTLGRVQHGYRTRIRRNVQIPPDADSSLCPIQAVDHWRNEAQIFRGPLFRPVTRHGRVGIGRLSAAGVNRIVQRAVARTGVEVDGYSAESLRARAAAAAVSGAGAGMLGPWAKPCQAV